MSKLLLLKGYTDLANQLQPYSSKVVSMPDLFRTTRIPGTAGSPRIPSVPFVPQSFSSIVQSSTPPSTPNRPAFEPPEIKSEPRLETVKHDIESVTSSDDSVDIIEWKDQGTKAKSYNSEWQER